MSYRDSSGELRPFRIVRDVIILIVAVVFVWGSVGTVKTGFRGVETRFSAVTGDVLGEGLYFKLPFVDDVIPVSVQTQKEEANASAASKDLQLITSQVAVIYHVNPSTAAKVYQEMRNEYGPRVIQPAIQEAVKASTAKYTAEELVTIRDQVKAEIESALREKLTARGIEIETVNVVDFDYSKSFNDAIEAKVTAEQDALAAKNKLDQVKYEAQQKIETAKGEAEAIRVKAAQLDAQSPEYLEWLRITTWDGHLPQVTGGATPFINLNK